MYYNINESQKVRSHYPGKAEIWDIFYLEVSMKTAILVDGAFYRRRAYAAHGDIAPEKRADELINYCHRHLRWHSEKQQQSELYRIFYYDCPPLDIAIYHPYLKKNVNLEIHCKIC